MPQAISKLPAAADPEPTSDAKELAFVESLKAKHGVSKVYALDDGDGHVVYVRMPSVGVWRRFRSQIQDARKRDEAGQVLFYSCLLHPDAEAFRALVELQPGIVDSFASEVCELAGLAKDVEKKVF